MTSILVIDDEELIRQRLANLLALDGYQVQVAESGRQGLDIASRDNPNLIIADIKMPGMDGIEVLRSVKQASPDTEVIIITGHGGVDTAVKALRESAFDYVTKPIDYDALEIAIRRALEKQGLVRQRRQAETRLRQAAEEWEVTFNSIRDLVSILDKDFRLVKANRAFAGFFGIAPEEAPGARCDSMFPPEVGRRLARCHQQTLTTGAPCLEEVFLPDQGIYFEVSMSPISNGDGSIAGTVQTARDITERKRAETERRRWEVRIQQVRKLESLAVLAGGIAHDFNNLLVSMLGNAALTLEDLNPQSPLRANIEDIQIAARRAADLTKQMLAFSGRGKFVFHRLSLGNLIREMSHRLEDAVPKIIQLKFELREDLPDFEADAAQLRQVFMTLITNAVEAIGESAGVITVRTGIIEADSSYLAGMYLDDDLSAGGYIFFEVADTGCGMDTDTKERIFDPFFTTKFTGRGLGLPAALGIVRAHGGGIKVDSQLGLGSVFRVLLPCNEVAPGITKWEDHGDERWRGTGTVLVIDDEPGIQKTARRILEKAGFTVVAASDGYEGLERFRANADEMALVLLDLTMPHGGEQTFHELRAIRPDVPIILSSGYCEQEATACFAGDELSGFIHKPYEPKELLVKLRSVLEEPAATERR